MYVLPVSQQYLHGLAGSIFNYTENVRNTCKCHLKCIKTPGQKQTKWAPPSVSVSRLFPLIRSFKYVFLRSFYGSSKMSKQPDSSKMSKQPDSNVNSFLHLAKFGSWVSLFKISKYYLQQIYRYVRVSGGAIKWTDCIENSNYSFKIYTPVIHV